MPCKFVLSLRFCVINTDPWKRYRYGPFKTQNCWLFTNPTGSFMPWMLLRCLKRLLLSLNALRQIWQEKGFSPVCTRKCFIILHSLVDAFPHMLHRNFFSRDWFDPCPVTGWPPTQWPEEDIFHDYSFSESDLGSRCLFQCHPRTKHSI